VNDEESAVDEMREVELLEEDGGSNVDDESKVDVKDDEVDDDMVSVVLVVLEAESVVLMIVVSDNVVVVLDNVVLVLDAMVVMVVLVVDVVLFVVVLVVLVGMDVGVGVITGDGVLVAVHGTGFGSSTRIWRGPKSAAREPLPDQLSKLRDKHISIWSRQWAELSVEKSEDGKRKQDRDEEY
jgi:hypothetical protein